MRALELGALWVVVGVGCAAALLWRQRGGWLDAALLVPFWPLLLPFHLLAQSPAPPAAPARESAFLEALRRASGTPLASLLPSEATAKLLARRLRLAEERVAEIDRLLAQRDVSDERAPAARLRTIERIRALRERFARELDDVGELLVQLRLSAEVVRLAGATDDGTRELVANLVARVEGLDEALGET